MRLVFFGTPDFAAVSLQALLEAGHDVVGVVTQPDRPSGRGRKLMASPVKEIALGAGLKIFQPEQVRDPAFQAELSQLAPAINIVVAFGQKIPTSILTMAPFGCVNVHASLLPRYRGAAPIQRVLMAGEQVTGVTTMYMDAGWDTGDIILQKEVPISPTMTGGELHDVLATAGAELLVETLRQIAAGTAPRQAQAHELATYAAKLTRADEILDWAQPAETLANQIRALNPWPGAVTEYAGNPLKIWQAKIEAGFAEGSQPGTVLACDPTGFVVQCGEQALRILEVQPSGKKKMAASAFLRGYPLACGEILGRSRHAAP